jgi:hypothetical protein
MSFSNSLHSNTLLGLLECAQVQPLSPLTPYPHPQEFYEANKDKPLTLLKWLVTQSSCAMPGNVSNVRKLMEHPAFQITNPNCCYSLFLGFARSINFHAADGSGYEFVGDAVLKVRSPVGPVVVVMRGDCGPVMVELLKYVCRTHCNAQQSETEVQCEHVLTMTQLLALLHVPQSRTLLSQTASPHPPPQPQPLAPPSCPRSWTR